MGLETLRAESFTLRRRCRLPLLDVDDPDHLLRVPAAKAQLGRAEEMVHDQHVPVDVGIRYGLKSRELSCLNTEAAQPENRLSGCLCRMNAS